MASSSGIRAAKAFIEIGTDTAALQRGLNTAKAKLQAFSTTLKSSGTALVAAGAGIAAPIVAGVKGYADFEQALANLRAAANPTAQQFDAIRESALALSKDSGIAPTAIVQAYSELLKAGVSVESVLNGAGEAAVRFARVGELDTAEAAVTMADALKVFARDGLSASQITDILSGAADSSSVSIRQITEAFQQTSASAGLAGQSLTDTATAIAMLGNEGIKGSDAGTSLKTALLRLMNPTKEAAAMMARYGIEVRNADGSLKSLPEIAGQLQNALGGLNDEAKQVAVAEIFGSDAMRTGAILLKYGTGGFNELKTAILGALPVSEKFKIVMNTLWGRLEAFTSAIMRAGIAIGTALAPHIAKLAGWLVWAVDGLAKFIAMNPKLAIAVAASAIAITALGIGLVGIGFIASAVGAIFAAFAIALGIIVSPAFWVAAAIVAISAAAVGLAAYILKSTGAMGYFFGHFSKVWMGIKAAIASGDLGLAFNLLMAGIVVTALKTVQVVLFAIGDLIQTGIKSSMGAYTFVRRQLGLISDEAASFEAAVVGAAANAIGQSVSGAVDIQLAAAKAALDALAAKSLQKGGKGVIGAAIEWGMSAAGGMKPRGPATPSNPYGTAMGQFIGQFMPKMQGVANKFQDALQVSFASAGSFRGQDMNRLLDSERYADTKRQTELLQQIASNTANMGGTFK